MTATSRTVCVALTGASGMPYALRLLQVLAQSDVTVWVLTSSAAQVVLRQELPSLDVPTCPADLATWLVAQYGFAPDRVRAFGREEWFAPPASGSSPPDAMVICPCSMGSLAAVATGLSDSLIERAADVVIKEHKKLILVPRETPFSVIHLEHMLSLARLGVVILPPNPGFYHHPQRIEDLVDYVVARILDHLDVAHALLPRWGVA